ncbi:MAG TPA: hypothetical protein VJR89_12390, partial [Polyangiales bacterium]|nr:hypothetical protein [Polyangiales bacterium]
GLRPWVDAGVPVVVLEPSCASVFRDELTNLMPARSEAQRLRQQTKLLSEFLVERDVVLPQLERRAVVQGHCHHKAVLGYDAERSVFERMGVRAQLLSSGCCGMAGAFGFERDSAKQHVSRACGERVLFGAVHAADGDTLVVADGFSCKTQIESGTGRRALHVAEVIQLGLAASAGKQVDGERERRVQERVPEQLAPVGLLCLGAAAALGALAFRAHAARTV